ncbi:MAG: hypothetical protein GY870_00610, partial [archaeon]|nr:hypothetical protein [archaeon]
MKKKSDNRYLKFEGTHKELGLQQGRACSELLKKTHAMIEGSEEVKQIKPFFIPMLFAKWGFRQIMGLYFLSTLKKDAPSQFDKLQGIAEGSGQDIKHLLSLQWTELEMSRVNFELQNCSAAGITGKRSITGEPVMIYNFDYP